MLFASLLLAAAVPELPDKDGAVSFAAQEWPLKPGPRQIKVTIHYPGGALEKADATTGIMLSLHNWGGSGCIGTADPVFLAKNFNVIALCVDYLQSGKKASIDDPEPYDFGYLQALDALRALHFVFDGLKRRKVPFASGRIYCTGGSGGGNVTLMANKLAPRTFACIIDLCGMARLSDDIAFNLPGGSDLDARYSREPKSPNHLSPDAQQLRFVGHPAHLKVMKELGNTCKIVVVHGAEDRTCPVEDKREMTANMKKAELDVEPHWITRDRLDGKVFTSTGHSLGNRTEIVAKVARWYLTPGSRMPMVRRGPSDFERRDEKVRYATANGVWIISYQKGYPEGRFER
jgi:predicted esterase